MKAGDCDAPLLALRNLVRARAPAPLWLRVQPLLPSFFARLLFAARSAIAIALVFAFIATNAAGLLGNNFFAFYCAVVASTSTLGGSLRAGVRMIIAGGFGAAVNAAVIVGGAPQSLALVLCVIAASTAVVEYTQVSVPARRTGASMVIIGLLVFYESPTRVGAPFVLGLWLGVVVGVGAAVVAALLPLPVLGTARRDATSRLRLASGALRRALAAVALSHVHEEGGVEGGGTDEPLLLRADVQEALAAAGALLAAAAEPLGDAWVEPQQLAAAALAWWDSWSPTPRVPRPEWSERAAAWASSLVSLLAQLQTLGAAEAAAGPSRLHAPRADTLRTPTVRAADAAARALDAALVAAVADGDAAVARATAADARTAAAALRLAHAAATAQEHHNGAGSGDTVARDAFVFALLRTLHMVLAVAGTNADCEASISDGSNVASSSSVVVRESLVVVESGGSAETAAPYQPTSASLPPSPKAPPFDVSALNNNAARACHSFNPSGMLRAYASSIGLAQPSAAQALRALRTTSAVLLATGLAFAAQASSLLPVATPARAFWASVTVVFCLGDALSAPTYARLLQRLVGTLVGAVFALLLSDVASPAEALGLLTAWVALLSYFRAAGAGAYWAFVAAFTAPVLLLVTVGDGAFAAGADIVTFLVVARVTFTLIGLFSIVLVYGVLLPVSTRALVREAGHTAATALGDAALAVLAAHSDGMRNHALSLTALTRANSAAAALTELLPMAAWEPQLWRTPFVASEVHFRTFLAAARRVSIAARALVQATTADDASAEVGAPSDAQTTVAADAAISVPPFAGAGTAVSMPTLRAPAPADAAIAAALAAVRAGAPAVSACALLFAGIVAETVAVASSVGIVLALTAALLRPSDSWGWALCATADARAATVTRQHAAAAASEALAPAVDALERALAAHAHARSALLSAYAAAASGSGVGPSPAGSIAAARILASSDALRNAAATFALRELAAGAAAAAAAARRVWLVQSGGSNHLYA